jgi:hypothetical protein
VTVRISGKPYVRISGTRKALFADIYIAGSEERRRNAQEVERLCSEVLDSEASLSTSRIQRALVSRSLARRILGNIAAPVLATAAAASVEGRVALGPRAGTRVRPCGTSAEDNTFDSEFRS